MYIILIISFLLGGLIFYFFSRKEKVKKKICIWGFLHLFFYGALRSTSIGVDVPSYAMAYMSLPGLSFKEIFTSTHLLVSRDPVFYTFLKFLTFLNEDPQFMLVTISLIVALCVSIFIYRYSVSPILSFTMFITLRYFSFTLSGLRQGVALGLVLLSIKYIKEEKLLKFILLVCFASLFHLSALVFLIAYPLSKIKRINWLSILIFSTMVLNLLTGNGVVKLIVKLPVFNQYEGYVFSNESTSSGTTMLLIYLCIIAFAFIVREQFVKNYDDAYLMYNLSIVGIAITSLTFDFPNIFRMGYYFVVPIIVLLPAIIRSSLDRRFQHIVVYIVIILLAGQFILIGPGAGTENYQFFWK
ncbi:EpsG family protein [Alkalihalobacterium bogoriense]|uniref:EpsG family protein n=1 Tax=Alkalihalobacterium bogoriense TaxID=246272 RepID=UPI00047D7BBC|nr:EpsG family protein [Alkalihalobacterium bogoriense]